MAGKVDKNGLTAKQEAACQAYIINEGNQSAAYREAYNAENMTPETVWQEASRTFNLPHVTARVLELQEMHRERHNVTVDTITKELEEARQLALAEKQAAAATGASMGKAKIHGLATDKLDITTKGKRIKNDWHVHPVTVKKD